MNTRPPDDWDEDYGPPTAAPRTPGTSPRRPPIDGRARDLRAAWIAGVRDFHARRSGLPSAYNSNVHWDGGEVATRGRSGVKQVKPVWPGLVEKADRAGIADPADMVWALFAHWPSDTAPTPPNLVDEKNLGAARNYRTNRRTRVALAIRAEEGVFRMATWAAGLTTPDPREAVTFVLNDIGRDLSPLFRYSLAVLRNHPTVAARWRLAAENQFRQDPGLYLDYWAKILPPDLQRAALTAAGAPT